MATYNKMVVKLAPHILYTRHDEMFIDAVTIERDGRPPRELKLGTFKLAGLNDVSLIEETFEAMHGLYDQRSEERRVGKEGVSTCRSRWSQYHKKQNTKKQ